MAETYWSQDNFTQGEISPLLYARATLNSYNNGLKTATNVLALPQGAAAKRFGTKFLHDMDSTIATTDDYEFKTFPYLDECIYLLVIRDDEIDIYMESSYQTTVTGTSINSGLLKDIRTTVLENDFIICTGVMIPKVLERLANTQGAANPITAFTASTLTATATIGAATEVYYARFDGAPLPTTVPAISAGVSYWIRLTGTNVFQIHPTYADAVANTNAYTISSAGTSANVYIQTTQEISGFTADTLTVNQAIGITDDIYPVRFRATTLPAANKALNALTTYFIRLTSSTEFGVYLTAVDAEAEENALTFTSAGTAAEVNVLNRFQLGDYPFTEDSVGNYTELPQYDFADDYSAINFTPSAATGNGITITASSGYWSSLNIGGLFYADGGVARLIFDAANSSTVHYADVLVPFATTPPVAIPGRRCFITTNAWTDERGWPKVCSSYQNRAIFANTDALPNGIWLSTINDYKSFDDAETLDSSAISWYPTSDTVDSIQYITPYRSLTVHTNSGSYSTPLSQDTAITPTNFSLALQDPTPATSVEPKPIDNQIIVISGNDVHALVWDGINNAYATTIVSYINEHLIRNVTQMAPYIDFNNEGSRYMFFCNADGTVTIYQSLVTEDISGFTQINTNMYDGDSTFNLVEATTAISSFSATSLTATGSNFDQGSATKIDFTIGTLLPTSTPQVVVGQFYYALGIDADEFEVYSDEALTNQIAFSNAGTGASVREWTTSTDSNFAGASYFRNVVSAHNGRLWFGTEREDYTVNATTAISAFTSTTLTATGSNIDASTGSLVDFTIGTSLPTSSPQIVTGRYYYALGTSANEFEVYTDPELTTRVTFSSAGTSANVREWTLGTQFKIEELDFECFTDCTKVYSGSATSTITGLDQFDGKNVQVNGDGYGFNGIVYNGELDIEAHGQAVEVSEATIGYGIGVELQPLPLTIATGNSIKTTSLTQPKHIRTINFMFNETVDAYVDGVPVAVQSLGAVSIGTPPTPASGLFEYSVMQAWDDFNNTAYTLTHNAPFGMRLLGVFYKVDVG